jgi:hypothetical protein
MMTRRRIPLTAVSFVLVVAAALVIRNQIKVYRSGQARHAAMQRQHPVVPVPADVGLHPEDARNRRWWPDCQAPAGSRTS